VQPPDRIAYLDNLRVLLTVLVVLHHIAAGYGDIGAWYYHEPVSGPGSLLAFTFLMAINQTFFMGFFFLLAGYFVPGSLARKGTRAFLRDRLVRLGVPLLVYYVLINPLVCRIVGGAGWEPGPGPMWFVELLLVFTIGYPVATRVLPAAAPLQIDVASTTMLALGMGLASFLIRTHFPVNVWVTFPTMQPAHVSQYVCLFAVGAWASGSDLGGRLSPALVRYWHWMMLLASAGVLAAFISADIPGDGRTTLEPLIGGWTWQSLVTSLWEQTFAVGLIAHLLRTFRERRNAAGPILSSAAASAYTVYIVHPVVVVLLALALRDLAVPSVAKFLLAAPIAVIALFAAARYIRTVPLLREVL
jgi:hypothetical protein